MIFNESHKDIFKGFKDFKANTAPGVKSKWWERESSIDLNPYEAG